MDFLPHFLLSKLASLANILIGEERVGNRAARINNSKECLRGESGNMIILWLPLSLLTGYTASVGGVSQETFIVSCSSSNSKLIIFIPTYTPEGRKQI